MDREGVSEAKVGRVSVWRTRGVVKQRWVGYLVYPYICIKTVKLHMNLPHGVYRFSGP